jgi:hypothetical protein
MKTFDASGDITALPEFSDTPEMTIREACSSDPVALVSSSRMPTCVGADSDHQSKARVWSSPAHERLLA